MRGSITAWLVAISGVLALLLWVSPKFQRTDGPGYLVIYARNELALYRSALFAFEIDTGHPPSSKNGLLALLRQPPGVTNWHGPYLDADTVPKDPWGHDYVYTYPGQHNTNSFDLMSRGPDGRPGTEDDIVNWKQPK